MLRITILPTPRTVTCTDISAVVRHGGRGVSESATSGFRGRVTPDPGRGFLRVYCRLHSELIGKLRIVSPHSNMSDQPCHLQYRCVTTTVKRAQARIQIKWKRSETRSRCLPRRWTSPPPPVPENIRPGLSDHDQRLTHSRKNNDTSEIQTALSQEK